MKQIENEKKETNQKWKVSKLFFFSTFFISCAIEKERILSQYSKIVSIQPAKLESWKGLKSVNVIELIHFNEANNRAWSPSNRVGRHSNRWWILIAFSGPFLDLIKRVILHLEFKFIFLTIIYNFTPAKKEENN